MRTARPSTGSASDGGRRRHNADALAVRARGGGLGVAVADGIGDSVAAVEAAHLAANAAAHVAAEGNALDALLAARGALPGSGDAVLVVAALRPGHGEIAWVGDCRASLFDGVAIASVPALAPDAAIAARELTDLALPAGGGDSASATVIEVPLVPALPVRHSDTGSTLPAVTRRLESA